MEDLELDLTLATPDEDLPVGVEIVPLAVRHERAMFEVAKEANADVPSPEPFVLTTFAAWRRSELGPCVFRELSFVALEDGEVVGWATLGEDRPGSAQNFMTGVARQARGRGVARALKLAQITAARDAGLHRLRTQNDVANGPCVASTSASGTRCAWPGFISAARCCEMPPPRAARARHDFAECARCVRIRPLCGETSGIVASRSRADEAPVREPRPGH